MPESGMCERTQEQRGKKKKNLSQQSMSRKKGRWRAITREKHEKNSHNRHVGGRKKKKKNPNQEKSFNIGQVGKKTAFPWACEEGGKIPRKRGKKKSTIAGSAAGSLNYRETAPYFPKKAVFFPDAEVEKTCR